MKWLNLFLIIVVVVGFNACQRRSASDYNLIKLPTEQPLPTPASGNAPDTKAPAADSTPAKGYM